MLTIKTLIDTLQTYPDWNMPVRMTTSIMNDKVISMLSADQDFSLCDMPIIHFSSDTTYSDLPEKPALYTDAKIY